MALHDLPTYDVEGGHFNICPEDVGAQILQLFAQWHWSKPEAHAWLVADIEALARQMAMLLLWKTISLRVELVRDDACRKFHKDNMTARLLCTYAGPGTEYGWSQNGEMPESILAAPTACPMLMKGKTWPSGASAQILHRSPPIEGTGLSRLVVVMNDAPH